MSARDLCILEPQGQPLDPRCTSPASVPVLPYEIGVAYGPEGTMIRAGSFVLERGVLARDLLAVDARSIAYALGGKRVGNEYRAFCPVHESARHGNPGLTIREDRGQVLFKCFGGCSSHDVVAELRKTGLWGSRSAQRRTVGPAATPAPAPHRDTSAYARQLWASANRDDNEVARHPYAKRKGLRHGYGAGRGTASGFWIGRSADCLLVPIRIGGVGDVVSVQCINADGAKQTFGPMVDSFLLLGNEAARTARWILAEGWATAHAFAHHWHGIVACIAFGKGRFDRIADRICSLYQPAELVILKEQDA